MLLKQSITGLTEALRHRDSLYFGFGHRTDAQTKTIKSKNVCDKPKRIIVTDADFVTLPSQNILDLFHEKSNNDMEIISLYHNDENDEESENEEEEEWLFDYINGGATSNCNFVRKKLEDDASDSIISLSSESSDDIIEEMSCDSFADLARLLLSPKPLLEDCKQFEEETQNKLNQNIDKDTKYLICGFLRRLSSKAVHNDEIFALSAAYLFNNDICFDEKSENMHISCNGFKYGMHEWEIKLNSFGSRMEIGIVENTSSIGSVQKHGVSANPKLGARAMYGHESQFAFEKRRKKETKTYYGSYNADNSVRCKKKTINRCIGWKKGDVIKVALNLRRGNIQFFLNGIKVRKTLSLEKQKLYHPMIAFCGECNYELISYK